MLLDPEELTCDAGVHVGVVVHGAGKGAPGDNTYKIKYPVKSMKKKEFRNSEILAMLGGRILSF